MVVKVIYGSSERVYLCDSLRSTKHEDRIVVELLGPDDDAPPLRVVTLNQDGQHLYAMLDVNDGRKNTVQSYHWPPFKVATPASSPTNNSNDSSYREESV